MGCAFPVFDHASITHADHIISWGEIYKRKKMHVEKDLENINIKSTQKNNVEGRRSKK